jgi:DNA-binding NtrC family response regulator
MGDEEIKRSTGERSSEKPSPRGRTPRVLVVDDEEALREINSLTLMGAGYSVDTVENGATAWDALQATNYDLLITDNNMPKMSGTDLIKKIWASHIVLPVIIATGTEPSDFAPPPYSPLGVVLLKPYTSDDLLRAVKNILEMSASFKARS